ncbi:MAG: hypothetical protein ACLT98_17685, partial [Eggerthellaceae bacterium]
MSDVGGTSAAAGALPCRARRADDVEGGGPPPWRNGGVRQRSSASAEAAAGATVGERPQAAFAGFVAAQAPYSPARMVAQLALAVMAVLCLPSSGMAHGIPVVSGMLAAATVLVGLPELLASAAHRVAELEYACRFDCRAVALARLIVLGCSDVVTVTAIALAAPVMLGADPFASLVHACVPYFL